jgi:hypothetical protein
MPNNHLLGNLTNLGCRVIEPRDVLVKRTPKSRGHVMRTQEAAQVKAKILPLAAAAIAGVAAMAPGATRAAVESSPQAVPIMAPGGELDPAQSGSGVYKGVPQAGKPPAGAACRVAKAYVDAIQQHHYADVAKLYTDDAVFLGPMGKLMQGGQAINQFYVQGIGKMRSKIVAVTYMGDETDCMVELAAVTDPSGEGPFRLVSVDHFTLNAAGKVKRMVVFVRP